jgi:hypothetical protein
MFPVFQSLLGSKAHSRTEVFVSSAHNELKTGYRTVGVLDNSMSIPKYPELSHNYASKLPCKAQTELK